MGAGVGFVSAVVVVGIGPHLTSTASVLGYLAWLSFTALIFGGLGVRWVWQILTTRGR